MKKLSRLALVAVALFSLASCRPADTVKYNIQVDADNFDVKRRMTFINLRSESATPLYSVEGYFSVQTTYYTEYAGQQELGILIETGPKQYKMHYFGLGDGVTYVIEQLDSVEGDKYHYTILWYVPLPEIESV